VSEEPSSSRGTRTLRALVIVLVTLVVLWLLFTQVFPRVERYLDDPTLGLQPSPVTPADHG
jgi:hypothetical protein